jgi:hypothetical protein
MLLAPKYDLSPIWFDPLHLMLHKLRHGAADLLLVHLELGLPPELLPCVIVEPRPEPDNAGLSPDLKIEKKLSKGLDFPDLTVGLCQEGSC